MEKRKNKPGAGRPVENWAPEKIKLLKKLYPTTDNETVAAKLKVSVSALRNAAVRFGVKKLGWTLKEEDFVRDNFNSMTYDKIGAKLGKTKWQVIKKARELKLTPINNSD